MSSLALANASCSTAEELIKVGEGLLHCQYIDTTRHRSICYGFNLEAESARNMIASVNGDFKEVYNGGCL